MLCSLCQHGVNAKKTWSCTCGEINCGHIDRCICGLSLRGYREALAARVTRKGGRTP